MKSESKERIEQRKAVNLVRSIMKLYLEKSGRYSKEEIERRINENIKRVNLRPRDNDYLGEASIDEPEITIYGVDDRVPTVDEIIFNLAYYKPTILHEGEHKFFAHKDEEGNVTGTGLLRLINRNRDFKQWLKENMGPADMKQIERFAPNAQELKKRKITPEIFKSEIGRGINEGFVEWYRVEVLGNKDAVNYENITAVLYKLQEYLDEKGEDGVSSIAEYGDSDYDYVFDTLNMSKPTGIAFVRILDAMYYLLEKKKVDRMDDIIRYFELEEENVLQPEFLSRYGEGIRSLNVFRSLQEEYKKMPYRKECFKEFVSRKNEEKNRALLRYQRLISDFITKSLEKREKGQGALEMPDISGLVEQVAILSAQNMDDIAEGMKVSFEKHRLEEREKAKRAKNKNKTKKGLKIIVASDIKKSTHKGEDIAQEQAEEQLNPEEGDLETGNALEQGKEEEDLETGSALEQGKEEGDLETGSALEQGKEERDSEIGSALEQSIVGFKQILEVEGGIEAHAQRSVIDNISFDVSSTVEDIKLDVKDVIGDIRYNVNDMVDDIKFGLRQRKIARATVKEQKRYLDKAGKLTLIALAAAAGISFAALTSYIIGQLSNTKDIPNVQIAEPQVSDDTKRPLLPIEIPEVPIQTPEAPEENSFPFLNEDGTISLKAGSTIYRSSDKVGGKTTLKYDYDNLIIDYIKLMQNTNQVVDTGDLLSLKPFMESLGEEDMSLMMRLAVEQNGEKVYIAWCDYAEMLENAKDFEEVEKTEDTER